MPSFQTATAERYVDSSRNQDIVYLKGPHKGDIGRRALGIFDQYRV